MFTPNLPAAARRHLQAADALDPGHRRDVAGYLYGIAAECATKAMMQEVGIHSNDAFFAHFPELRTLLRDHMGGRRAQRLAVFIQDDAFMNNWHIHMRYAEASQIENGWVDRWRDQAKRAVNTMGTLG